MSAVDQVIAAAQAELGKPYVFGTEGPNTFDCSGLTAYAMAQAGISLPHNAAEQQKMTTRVATPAPGDLVFFGDPAYHVGLYIGGGKMISAPHSGATVHITDVGTPTNYGRVKGLGAGVAGAVDTVQTGLSTVGSTVGGWLGGARYIVLEGLAVGFGVGLVGYGLYRTVAPAIKQQYAQVEEALAS